MGPGKGIAGILEHVFVELFILFFFNICLIANPERFVLVDSLELNCINVFSGGSINRIFNFLII
jgi:hypothetical protein